MSGTQTAIFFVVVYVHYKDLWISFLSTGQTTDNRQQTTDGQTQILNPALGMRAQGKKNGKSLSRVQCD